MAFRPTPIRAASLAGLLLIAVALQGCVAATVAGGAVSMAGAAVGTAAKVGGAAVHVTASAAGAAGRAVTGG